MQGKNTGEILMSRQTTALSLTANTSQLFKAKDIWEARDIWGFVFEFLLRFSDKKHTRLDSKEFLNIRASSKRFNELVTFFLTWSYNINILPTFVKMANSIPAHQTRENPKLELLWLQRNVCSLESSEPSIEEKALFENNKKIMLNQFITSLRTRYSFIYTYTLDSKNFAKIATGTVAGLLMLAAITYGIILLYNKLASIDTHDPSNGGRFAWDKAKNTGQSLYISDCYDRTGVCKNTNGGSLPCGTPLAEIKQYYSAFYLDPNLFNFTKNFVEFCFHSCAGACTPYLQTSHFIANFKNYDKNGPHTLQYYGICGGCNNPNAGAANGTILEIVFSTMGEAIAALACLYLLKRVLDVILFNRSHHKMSSAYSQALQSNEPLPCEEQPKQTLLQRLHKTLPSMPSMPSAKGLFSRNREVVVEREESLLLPSDLV